MANPPGNMPPSKPDVGPNFSPDIKAPKRHACSETCRKRPTCPYRLPSPPPGKAKLTTEEALKRAMNVEGGENGQRCQPRH